MLHRWRPAVLKTLLAAIIVYFVARSLPFKAAELLDYLARADYRFYLSMALFAVFLMLQASIWVLIVNAVGMGNGAVFGRMRTGGRGRLGLLQGLRIFIDSQFAKYIPGGFWNYAGRIVLAMREGVPLAALLSSIVYENVLLVAAALTYALVLAVNLNVEPVLLLLVSASVVVMAYVYYNWITRGVGRIFEGVSRWKPVRRLLGRRAESAAASAGEAEAADSLVHAGSRGSSNGGVIAVGSSGEVGRSIGGLSRNPFFAYLSCFIMSHFVMGIAFWVLSNSYGAGQISVLYAAGTFAASWLIGLLSPLPGGLGVREGFLVYFLSLKLGTDAALHLSIIARLWNVMAEVTFWALIQTVSIFEKRVRSYET